MCSRRTQDGAFTGRGFAGEGHWHPCRPGGQRGDYCGARLSNIIGMRGFPKVAALTPGQEAFL